MTDAAEEDAPPAQSSPPGMRVLERDLRLDACRGIALWCIFLDHVPDNIGSWFTLRNYGFSDTTEVFMFVSGLTCALAYGKVLQRDGWGSVIAHTVRRSFEIYVAFLVLMLACAVLAYLGGNEQYLHESNTHILFDQTGTTLSHALILQYRPFNSDVLPTFELFHLLVAPLLWSLRRAPNATLAASVLLYVLTRYLDWNLPQWPRNGWYFNPFAWQVLFVCGAWWSAGGGTRLWPLIRAHVPVVAIGYLLFGLVVVLGWTVTPLETLIPAAISKLIYPIDKSGLDPLRLFHFLALAALAAHYIPPDWLGFGDRAPIWRRSAVGQNEAAPESWSAWLRRHLVAPVMRGAIRCGENSLAIYCLGVVLSLAGYIFLDKVAGGVAAQAAVSLAGIGVMVAVATAIAWTFSNSRHQPGLF
jgi:hypothetical protein